MEGQRPRNTGRLLLAWSQPIQPGVLVGMGLLGLFLPPPCRRDECYTKVTPPVTLVPHSFSLLQRAEMVAAPRSVVSRQEAAEPLTLTVPPMEPTPRAFADSLPVSGSPRGSGSPVRARGDS